MIEICCDKCERTFEVPDDLAGGKAPCPACGDVNRVPPADEPSSPERAAPRASGEAGSPERELCIVRPAMFRAHPLRGVLLLAVLLGGGALAIAGPVRQQEWMGWAGLVVVAAGAIWWLVWWLSSRLWVRVVISNKRTVRHEGIVQRHSTEVLHDHVRSVDIRQNFVQRIFNVGYIGIDSAGQDSIEIELRDIPGPYEVKKLIDQYRRL